jgi:hypothetical protein
MMTDREIREAAARCVSIAVFYHNSPKTSGAEKLFEDDIRSVARWARQGALDEQESERRLLRPLRSELIARYGVEIGSSLRADFLAAYRDAWRSERPAPAAPPRHRAAPGHQEPRRP